MRQLKTKSSVKYDSSSRTRDQKSRTRQSNGVAHSVYDTICYGSNLIYSLGQLIKIIREPQMVFVVDKLIEFSSGKEDELRDIAGLGLRTK